MVVGVTQSSWHLGSDRPLQNPSQDAFGYAQFANRLATAIVDAESPQGLVLGVHGAWGSGKSSVLNFMKFDLLALEEQSRPVVIEFNPWWFEGRDQIATQLLTQFSSQLPDKLKYLRPLASLVGKYSNQIANVAADVSGWGWLKKPAAFILGKIPAVKGLTKKTDVPSVKREVEAALRKLGKRFVIFVDDIDRLTPDEARDFFRAIKALGDFPQVVYVLFFDREQVASALGASTRTDGEAYLEKIIQAPFNLPAVERELLRRKLFDGLDSIIESKPMPFKFDQGRWAVIFSENLDQFIFKPRDIVRVLNAIAVSYPPLAGEVNPVDFIALEFLRVFEPRVYGSIRDAQDLFVGTISHFDHKKSLEKDLFGKWNAALPDSSRDRIAGLVGRLFPKAAEAFGDGASQRGALGEWTKELRPCSPDCVGVYFQFGVPPGRVARAELERLVGAATPAVMAELLLEAKETRFLDGHSKARDLIERVGGFDQIPEGQAAKLVEALVGSGQQMLLKEDERGDFFSMPNRWRINGLICKLLERLPIPERQELLAKLSKESRGLWCLVGLTDEALQAQIDPSKAPKAMHGLASEFAEAMRQVVASRLDAAKLEELMTLPELDYIVHRWSKWGNQERIREVFKPMLNTDESLLALLDKFVRTGLRQSGNVTEETYQLSIKQLSIAVDLNELAPRLKSINKPIGMSLRQEVSIKRFFQSIEILAKGGDPDNVFFHDDLEG